MSKYTINIKLNGTWRSAEVSAAETLLSALREKMNAFEVKNGCGEGDCGACTVIVQGKPVNSCLTLAMQADGKEVVSLKGIGARQAPSPIQESFVEHGAIQCGFCTSGMIVSAKSVLDRNPNPSREEICEGLSGNLCRCTGYKKIVDAVSDAAGKCQTTQETAKNVSE